MYYILREPIVRAPNRRKKLLTFSEKKIANSKVSQLERDRQLLLTAMKKKIQHSLKIGEPIDQPGEQLFELPLAICDHNGHPIKGQKNYATQALEKRYENSDPSVFTICLPTHWIPECILMEGMFLLTTGYAQGVWRLCKVPDGTSLDSTIFKRA